MCNARFCPIHSLVKKSCLWEKKSSCFQVFQTGVGPTSDLSQGTEKHVCLQFAESFTVLADPKKMLDVFEVTKLHQM